ncbi:gastrula zinc finger protein XlCGF57.1-like [Folsomia candida]|uniref:gastrula zinc finger protein XlCGF57.1-like n=1 Tax=Folsomia candida TaxID=158441 RepID=UPI001604CB2A|nr:gastrula zinc finger protein XlCGF57.1-like [Folsomia candida]
MDLNEGTSDQYQTSPLDGRKVTHPHQKFLGGLQVLILAAEILKEEERSQEKGRLPPHTVQLARDDNHVLSPSTKNGSSKAKKTPQIGKKRGSLEKIVPCKTCPRTFTNPTSAARHTLTHLTSDELKQSSLFHEKCPHCEKVFFHRRDFTYHVAAHEGRKNHVCPICNKRFARKGNLIYHLVIHFRREERAAVARHGCYLCTKRIKTRADLNRHVECHTTEKVGEKCTTCGKTFFSNLGLTIHRFTHLTEEQKAALVNQGLAKECSFCLKKFPNNGTYRADVVTHMEEKRFLCDQCGAQFVRNSALKLHKLRHTSNSKPFSCDECDHTFTREPNLVIHKETVHRERKDISCSQCDKMFSTKSRMVTHVSSVHAQIRHPCPHCGKTFTQKGSLGTHLKKLHPPE